MQMEDSKDIAKIILVTITLLGWPLMALAQEPSDSQPEKQQKRHVIRNPRQWLNSLTQEQQDAFQAARQKALDAHPELQKEFDDFKSEQHARMQSRMTREIKETLDARFKAFEQKLEAAMIQIDPTMTSLFVKRDEMVKEWNKRNGN